jgi:hypothetical protein
MMPKKALLRLHVGFGWSLHGFDKTDQRGQGGAQFVRYVGDEIPTHLPRLFQCCHIIETHQHPMTVTQINPRGADLECQVATTLRGQVARLAGLAVVQAGFDGIQNGGMADGCQEMPAHNGRSQ